MNVAYVIATFPPHIGGMGEVCFQEARGMAERGHSVTVFTLNYPKAFYQDEDLPFTVVRLKGVLKFGDAGFVPNLFGKLKNFDIVHLHYPFYGGAEWVLLARIVRRQKYVLTFHMEARPVGFVKRLVQKVYDAFLSHFILAWSEKIIAVDNFHLKNTKIFPSIKNRLWQVIPHGVDSNLFRPLKIDWSVLGHEECREKKILLFVGNLLPLKRLDLLIKALHVLQKEQINDVVVWVLGDGYAMKEYQALANQYKDIKDKVYFLGACTDKNLLAQYYNVAWASIVTSTTESFSLVMNEARACGVPVVAGRIPGIQERIIFGVDGFLFEPGNVADLVEKLKKVLRLSVVQRNQMGLAGRKRVLSYDWEHHIDVISDLYTSIIKNGNS